MTQKPFQLTTFHRWIAGLGTIVLVLVIGVYFFPWDSLRGPINRYVSAQLGRQFEITQRFSVRLGLITTVRAEEVEIANPQWAQERFLLQAKAAEFEIRLWPLLFGKVVIPRIALTQPKIGLQIEPDGRRTWALSRDTSDEKAVPEIGTMLVDQGSISFKAKAQNADLDVEFSLAKEVESQLPLSFKAKGKWQNETVAVTGRMGGVLQLSEDVKAPFPLEINAVAGRTALKAKGSIENLASLAGIDATFDLQGQSMEDLYKLLGVVLPNTPPYKLRGQLDKKGKLWAVSQIQGVLGKSDIGGSLSFDQSAATPLLTGKVQSKMLDFADLGSVIGMAPVKDRAATQKVAPTSKPARLSPVASRQKASAMAPAPGKVLPVTPLDVPKLKAMNADIRYSAADIRHVRALPLDKGSVHLKLNAGVLQLEPISLGVAGGTIAGSIRIDSNVAPASITTKLDVRSVQLKQLFPTVETTKTALGKISGQFNLKGRGNSVAQMLGSASGDMAILMGQGEISNILLEFMGLDGGEVIKFLVQGDRNVELRCAAAAFDVKQGLMTSRAIVLDTVDTVITGEGQINLAHETVNVLLKPAPKDVSILSLRSPLRIGGTFGAPSAGPEKTALAGRAGLALLLGAINPLLALAATIETGPGKDADCAGVLKQAATPKASPAAVKSGKK